MANKNFIKRTRSKLSKINRLIGRDIQFYLDKQTGLFYAKIIENDSPARCIYIEHVPKGLFNVFRRRAIVSASAKIARYWLNIVLMCNSRTYELRAMPYDCATFHAPCYCVYDLQPLRFMGEETHSMFIGDRIYSADTEHGLWQVTKDGRQLVVALTDNGPEIVEGVKTTMYNGDYQNYYWGAFPDMRYFNIYGIQFLNPIHFENNDNVYVRYPIFEPITPADAYINELNQLTIVGRAGWKYIYNCQMEFESVVFHKGEDWPIELIKADSSSSRYNLIIADHDDRGSRDPFLIDQANIAHRVTSRRPFEPFKFKFLGYNRFGPLRIIAERTDEYPSYVPCYEQNPYDGSIKSEVFAKYCEPLQDDELCIEVILADEANNHYVIYNQDYTEDSSIVIKQIHLRSAPAKNTKAALH
jgi:hypothetical protein